MPFTKQQLAKMSRYHFIKLRRLTIRPQDLLELEKIIINKRPSNSRINFYIEACWHGRLRSSSINYLKHKIQESQKLQISLVALLRGNHWHKYPLQHLRPVKASDLVELELSRIAYAIKAGKEKASDKRELTRLLTLKSKHGYRWRIDD